MEERVWHRSYDDGVPSSLDYAQLTLPAILQRSAERFPGATAVVFKNARLTYAQFLAEVKAFAAGLAGLGVKRGTRVAIQLPNLPQTPIAYYAALWLGAEVVMTNPLYTPRELEHQWSDSGCELAVVADFLFDQKIAAARSSLAPKTYVIASIPEYLRFPLNLLAPLKLKKADPPLYAKVPPGPGLHRFKDVVKSGRGQSPALAAELDDVAALQYTGGTTGLSKGAVLTHRNLSVNVQQIDGWFTGVQHGDEAVLCALPIFHVFGMTVAMNWGVWAGAKLVLMPNPRDLPELVKLITKERVTLFPGVPAMFNGLCNQPGIDQVDVSSVKYCFSGSAPIPVEVIQRFEKLTGAIIVEGFGMSESSPVTHVNPLLGERKIGSVGVPFPDTDARVVDMEEGVREMPLGEEGELVMRGPQVMRGYWQRERETEATLRDGWLHTGDLAVQDEDGYFSIVGRKKDMIIAGGYNIYPDEVDRVLMAHEEILEAATIGIPDERRGETVKSYVVLQPGSSMDAAAVEAWCRENLAAYKVPRQIAFLDELPKSSTLKILRRELRDMDAQ